MTRLTTAASGLGHRTAPRRGMTLGLRSTRLAVGRAQEPTAISVAFSRCRVRSVEHWS